MRIKLMYFLQSYSLLFILFYPNAGFLFSKSFLFVCFLCFFVEVRSILSFSQRMEHSKKGKRDHRGKKEVEIERGRQREELEKKKKRRRVEREGFPRIIF